MRLNGTRSSTRPSLTGRLFAPKHFERFLSENPEAGQPAGCRRDQRGENDSDEYWNRVEAVIHLDQLLHYYHGKRDRKQAAHQARHRSQYQELGGKNLGDTAASRAERFKDHD